MVAFTVAEMIDRPVAVVDAALNHLDNHPKFFADLRRVELLSGKPQQVGSVSRLYYQDGSVMTDTLTEVQPGRRYVSRVEGGGLCATVETLLEDRGDTTRMTLRWEGRPNARWARPLFSLLRQRIARRAAEDLQTFKRLVEEHGSVFP